MAYTGHGHHIPDSYKRGTRPKQVARCGGPGRCVSCDTDIEKFWDRVKANESKKAGAMEVTVLGDLTREKKARTLVENYIAASLPDDQKSVVVEAYLLKLTRVQQDWKAILSTNINDEDLYEVMYLSTHKIAEVRKFSFVEKSIVRDGD